MNSKLEKTRNEQAIYTIIKWPVIVNTMKSQEWLT